MSKSKFYLEATDGKNKYPLMLIKWMDSHFPKHGWIFIDNDTEPEKKVCVSIGFVKTSKSFITVYPHIGFNGTDNFQGSGTINIPTMSVIEKVAIYSDKNHMK